MNAQRQPDRKQEILDLSVHLIEKHGYSGFSYQDLSSRLGIAKASIHHHFPSKEDLALAILDRVAGYLEETGRTLSEGPGSAWQRLERFYEGGCQKASCEKRVCVLSSFLSDYQNLPDSVQKRLGSVCALERTIVGGFLQSGRLAGELAFVGEPEQQAGFIINSMKGAMLYSRVNPGGAVTESLQALRRCLGLG